MMAGRAISRTAVWPLKTFWMHFLFSDRNWYNSHIFGQDCCDVLECVDKPGELILNGKAHSSSQLWPWTHWKWSELEGVCPVGGNRATTAFNQQKHGRPTKRAAVDPKSRRERIKLDDKTQNRIECHPSSGHILADSRTQVSCVYAHSVHRLLKREKNCTIKNHRGWWASSSSDHVANPSHFNF